MKKNILAVPLFLILSSGSALADTVYCVNCTNEVMDMVRQAQNFAQYAQQTSNLIQQLEVLRTQAARLNSDTPFSQTSALLTDIMKVVNQGQALGYNTASITKKFEGQYPDFDKQQGNYFDNYLKWSQTTADSIKSALLSAGMQMANFETESVTADTLRTMNKSATGQMQAIQIGNAVSSEMLDEMRKLRQLNTAQMQAQNAYLLNEQEKSNSSTAGLKSFLDQKNIVIKSDDEIRKSLKGVKP
jgi:P-type conjugative transfer protein TrbJ